MTHPLVSIYKVLESKFLHVRPDQTVFHKDCGYTAKPQSCTWFRIEDLEEIKKVIKSEGLSMRPRFRGPRSTRYINGRRRRYEALAQDCLKSEALYFAPYISC